MQPKWRVNLVFSKKDFGYWLNKMDYIHNVPFLFYDYIQTSQLYFKCISWSNLLSLFSINGFEEILHICKSLDILVAWTMYKGQIIIIILRRTNARLTWLICPKFKCMKALLEKIDQLWKWVQHLIFWVLLRINYTV